VNATVCTVKQGYVLYFWSNFFGLLPHSLISRLFASVELMWWLSSVKGSIWCRFHGWVPAPRLQDGIWSGIGSSVVDSRLLSQFRMKNFVHVTIKEQSQVSASL